MTHLIRGWTSDPSDESPLCGADRYAHDVAGARTVFPEHTTCVACLRQASDRTAPRHVTLAARNHWLDATRRRLVELTRYEQARVQKPLDTVTDYQDREWFVNDRVEHVISGVRRDAGRIVSFHSASLAVVEFDNGGRSSVRLADCELVRRRTPDEVPLS